MPVRIAKPWLLFDWIYELTKTSSSEMDQKQQMDAFTQEVWFAWIIFAQYVSKLNKAMC